MNTEEQQLADMLRRVAPEPPRPVTVEDVAFRLANGQTSDRARSWRRRHRESRAQHGSWSRRWAPALAAASVIVVAGASAGIASVLTSHPSLASGTSRASSSPAASPTSSLPVSSPAPSAHATSAPPTSPPERVADGMWDAELIDRDTFNQDSLTSGPDGLYGVSQGYLDRIDPATGDVVASVPSPAVSANAPVVTGDTVWALWSSTGTTVVLHGYDAKTLAQVASVTVPVSGSSSGAGLTSGSGGDLYLAAGSSVVVVNPATRQVIRQLTVSGPVNSVTVSPGGSRLYVSPEVSEGTVKLLIYNLATGALIGSSTTDAGSNGANLAATSGGVWGTMGEGMSEWVWFAPDGNLAQEVRVSQGAGAGLASVPVVSGGAVWIGGSHTLECADPATGRVLASATIPTDHSVVEYFSSVTITGGHAYAYYVDQQSQQQGVATLTPPAACSG